MHVEVRQSEDVVIVDFTGKLVAGDGDLLLREVINELVAEDWKKILLNLSGVSFLDSSGIGELVASLKLVEKFGASLKILKLEDEVRHILHLGQILPLFDVYDDEQKALEGFESGPEPPPREE